jgi:hypothetical protein
VCHGDTGCESGCEKKSGGKESAWPHVIECPRESSMVQMAQKPAAGQLIGYPESNGDARKRLTTLVAFGSGNKYFYFKCLLKNIELEPCCNAIRIDANPCSAISY